MTDMDDSMNIVLLIPVELEFAAAVDKAFPMSMAHDLDMRIINPPHGAPR